MSYLLIANLVVRNTDIRIKSISKTPIICQLRTTITIDNIKLCSYNCKGFSISKIKHIEELLSKSDILFLQETWLLKSQIGTINQYFSEFNTCGISGMNENVLIQGRRYGGCSFLYKKSLSANVTCIDMNSMRVCCTVYD